MSFRRILTLSVVLVACAGASPIGDCDDNQLFERLEAVNERDRHDAYLELLRRRRQRCKDLVKIAADKTKPPGVRQFAIRLLGANGCRSAIRTLAENLEFEYGEAVVNVSLLEGYPCAQALLAIGPSSVPEIVLSLARIQPDLVDEQAISIRVNLLIEIYVPDIAYGGRDEAIAVVERMRDRIPPLANLRRENVTRLLDALKAFPHRP